MPRTLEARGLDAAPLIRDKLQRAGDDKGAAILDIILREEIGHVAIGNRWYRWLCEQRGLDPLACYSELAQRHRAPRLRGPFNLEARRAAGFDEHVAGCPDGALNVAPMPGACALSPAAGMDYPPAFANNCALSTNHAPIVSGPGRFFAEVLHALPGFRGRRGRLRR